MYASSSMETTTRRTCENHEGRCQILCQCLQYLTLRLVTMIDTAMNRGRHRMTFREQLYNKHRNIATACFTVFISMSVLLMFLAVYEALQSPSLSNAVVFAAISGIPIPVAFTFLTLLLRAERCFAHCPTDKGYTKCMNKMQLPLYRRSQSK